MTAPAYDWNKLLPDFLGPLRQTHGALVASELDARLRHLITLRASQINRCAFCVDMHYREAIADGDTPERLAKLVVYHHGDAFTPAEKAALAWTEALTELHLRPDLPALRAALEVHFSEREIGLITAQVSMINLWNRLMIGRE